MMGVPRIITCFTTPVLYTNQCSVNTVYIVESTLWGNVANRHLVQQWHPAIIISFRQGWVCLLLKSEDVSYVHSISHPDVNPRNLFIQSSAALYQGGDNSQADPFNKLQHSPSARLALAINTYNRYQNEQVSASAIVIHSKSVPIKSYD